MTRVRNVQAGEGPQNRQQRRATAAQKSKPQPIVIAGVTVVTDSKGRKIGLRKLTVVERFELDDVLEAKTISAGMTIKLAASVVSIDEDGMTPVTSRAELHERLELLGDEGLEAITEPGLKMYGIDLSKLEALAAKN